MDVQLVSKDKDNGKLSFLINKSNAAFVNTLRRMILEEVPTLAIEDVEIVDNSSALYDEILAHRLGLIPISTDLKSYNLPQDCKCKGEGCASCQLKMTLKSDGVGIVTASEIKSKDPKCKPVYGKTPIVKLFKSPSGQNQSVELVATARLGQGKEHAKWSPGLVFFKANPNIEIKKDCEAAAKVCPVNVFDFNDGKLSINKDNLVNCHLCLACEDACPDGVKIVDNNSDFIFNIESWGQLEPKDIVKSAMDLFEKKCDDFADQLKAL